MNYIIDGYNLAFKIENIASILKNGNTDQVIKLVSQFVKNKLKRFNTKIVIVFDGKEYNQSKITIPGVKLIFSSKPQTADDIIRNFIRTTPQIKNWCVVSSDNEIVYTAQDHGAKNIKSDEFVKQTFTQKKSNNNMTHKNNPTNVDINYWLKLFEAGNEE